MKGLNSNLINKTVIITGASRGLGRHLALVFADHRANLALICKTNLHLLKNLAAEIEKSGSSALPLQCDVSNYAKVQKTIQTVFDKFGSIDILINNAGITHSSLLLKTTANIFDQVIATNLKGTFNCTKGVLKYMMQWRNGHIINISSLSAIKGIPGSSVYAASKTGVVALTLTIAREYAKYNIRANAVLPGFLQTDMTKTLDKQTQQNIVSENFLGRSSTFEEVTAFIIHLSTTENISGQVFNLDSRIKSFL